MLKNEVDTVTRAMHSQTVYALYKDCLCSQKNLQANNKITKT